MGKIDDQIEDFLAQVVRYAENKHEILLGSCKSNKKLTSTQEHILMLLKKGSSSNARISQLLKISPAAVTKALKKLQEMSLISSSRDSKDERVTYWQLTEEALPIAREHAEHHNKTQATYRQVVRKFTIEEQSVISRFLQELQGVFKEK